MVKPLKHERVRELLRYDAETGELFWRVARGRQAAGSLAGCDAGNGYRKLRIDGQEYYAHRVIFVYVLGRFPSGDVDHINGQRSDNRWTNLREVDRQTNLRNTGIGPKNKSGVVGVFWNAGKRKWTARIKVAGRNIHIGHFDSLEDAAAARRKAEQKHGFSATHGQRPAVSLTQPEQRW